MAFSIIEVFQSSIDSFFDNGMSSFISGNATSAEAVMTKTQSSKNAAEEVFVALDEMYRNEAEFLTVALLSNSFTADQCDDLAEQSNALYRNALENPALGKTREYFDPKHPTQRCVWF